MLWTNGQRHKDHLKNPNRKKKNVGPSKTVLRKARAEKKVRTSGEKGKRRQFVKSASRRVLDEKRRRAG